MQQYLQLVVQSFQTAIQRRGKCVAVAFTSSQSGEGVSYVVESFGAELARRLQKPTLIVSAKRLQSLSMLDFIRMPQCCYETDIPNLWLLPDEGATTHRDDARGWDLEENFDDSTQCGLGNVQALRLTFDYVLIDCPALSESGEAALLASSVDGLVMVVEANRTRHEQIRQTQRTIEMANGKVLGMVLNKRTYPVPNWLHRWL
jgi:hypothetical protein